MLSFFIFFSVYSALFIASNSSNCLFSGFCILLSLLLNLLLNTTSFFNFFFFNFLIGVIMFSHFFYIKKIKINYLYIKLKLTPFFEKKIIIIFFKNFRYKYNWNIEDNFTRPKKGKSRCISWMDFFQGMAS